MKKVLTILVVFLFCVSMVSAQNVAAPSGKYALVSSISDGEDLVALFKEMSAWFGFEYNPEDNYLEFQNNRFRMVMNIFGEIDVAEGTFTVSGRNITIITEDDESITGTIEGN